MQAKLIMGFNGTFAFTVDGQAGVSFEEAKAKLEQVEAILGAAGIPLNYLGGVEQHLHTEDGHHVHTTVDVAA